jgi:hypothetical protein
MWWADVQSTIRTECNCHTCYCRSMSQFVVWGGCNFVHRRWHVSNFLKICFIFSPSLTFENMFTYANTHWKISLEIHFIHLGKKEIYCTFKTCCIISVLFSTKCYLFHNFIFFFSNNKFLVNHALKFKYLPREDTALCGDHACLWSDTSTETRGHIFSINSVQETSIRSCQKILALVQIRQKQCICYKRCTCVQCASWVWLVCNSSVFIGGGKMCQTEGAGKNETFQQSYKVD